MHDNIKFRSEEDKDFWKSVYLSVIKLEDASPITAERCADAALQSLYNRDFSKKTYSASSEKVPKFWLENMHGDNFDPK